MKVVLMLTTTSGRRSSGGHGEVHGSAQAGCSSTGPT
jgi:hypothetical protein